MAAFMVDSTLYIQWGRGTGRARAWLEEHAADELYTSVISIAEVYAGVRPDDHDRWREYLGLFTEVPIDGATAMASGALRYRLARQGREVTLADGIIAAQALINGWPVVTANVGDFVPTGAEVVEVR